jgi:hypothetical protein
VVAILSAMLKRRFLASTVSLSEKDYWCISCTIQGSAALVAMQFISQELSLFQLYDNVGTGALWRFVEVAAANA